MFIKSIVIEGVDGDVKVSHTDEGAVVTVERFTHLNAPQSGHHTGNGHTSFPT